MKTSLSPNEFGKTINDFVQRLESLRDFAVTTEGFLEKTRNEIFETRHRELTPMYALNAKRFPMPEEPEIPEATLKAYFGGEFEILEDKTEDGTVSHRILIKEEELKESFDSALSELSKNQRALQLLRSNVLISLISAVEAYFSGLMHLYYAQYPDAIDSSEKTFTLTELKKFSTIADAQNYLIECKVEQLMRGSFEDWTKFFKTRLKLDLLHLGSCLSSRN